MRKATVLFLLAFTTAGASYAHAALVFNADFAQDGTYDSSWPMKAGDVVAVDLNVSSVPAPGLMSMGFKIIYNSSKLEVVTSGTTVHSVNWPVPYLKMDTLGEIEMAGFRLTGLAGDNIRLGTVTFQCLGEGSSVLMLLDREGDWFILDSGEVLDGDIGPGILLTTVGPALGNINGDGAVDLSDAILAMQVIAEIHQGYVYGNADVNGDGVIGIQEVICILQKLSGVRE